MHNFEMFMEARLRLEQQKWKRKFRDNVL